MTTFSIIIPAHNEEDVIEDCLKAITPQISRKDEIIVVNDGSTDNTKRIAKKYPVRLINFKEGHSAAFARNKGAEKAKNKWLIFIDADQIVEKDFIKRIRSFLFITKCDGTDFLVLPMKPKTFIQKAWSVYRKCNPSLGYLHIIKKSVFNRLKFDENVFYYEDEDLKQRFLKNGYIYKGPANARLYHIEPANWGDFTRQRKWQAKGVYSEFKKDNWMVLRYFVPCLLIPLTIVSTILFLFYFIYFLFKFSTKTGDLFGSFLWVSLDYVGRFISLFYFIKELF